MISWGIVCIVSFLIVLSYLSVLAYGKKTQEIILLNLNSGDIQISLIVLYALTIIQMIGLNLLPILDIIENMNQKLIL